MVNKEVKPSSGYIHPKALTVLEEINIGNTDSSKLADEFQCVNFDLVVTVCDSTSRVAPVDIRSQIRRAPLEQRANNIISGHPT
jgi:protein-tyrosine-phosphatase